MNQLLKIPEPRYEITKVGLKVLEEYENLGIQPILDILAYEEPMSRTQILNNGSLFHEGKLVIHDPEGRLDFCIKKGYVAEV